MPMLPQILVPLTIFVIIIIIIIVGRLGRQQLHADVADGIILFTSIISMVKKRLSPGDLPMLTKLVGPGNKKPVTKDAKCSIRWHPAFIG